jgi:FAD/FMN-containing dehydrogenase
MGYLRRKWGMTCDNLLSAEVVLADGSIVHASEDEHPDLFWGLRGGGGNFGIVTSFRYRLHGLGPEVYLAAPMFAAEDGQKVLRAWREFCDSAPDEAGPYIFFITLPASPPFPEVAWGRRVLVAACVWAGPVEDGEAALAPLRELAEPLVDLSGPQPYVDIQRSFDWFFPSGALYYWKTTTIDELSDAAIDTLLSECVNRPSNGTAVGLWQLGGAMARVAPEDTAYGRRDAPFLVNVDSGWTDPGETQQQVEWTRETHRALSNLSDGGLYLHYSSGEDLDTVKSAYGDNFDRLVELKRRYDPTNMFRGNQNIPPDAG